VAELAANVGYGSEAAFKRAFKRELDCPPAQFRRQSNVAPPAQRRCSRKEKEKKEKKIIKE